MTIYAASSGTFHKITIILFAMQASRLMQRQIQHFAAMDRSVETESM
jgi:hypothetical protein